MVADDPAPFRLSGWDIHPDRNRIVGGGREVVVEGKIMSVLVELAKRPGEVVPKNALLDAVWPNQAVADGVLTRAVYELRQLFRDDPRRPRFIETVPRVGYRLVAMPEALDAPPARRFRPVYAVLMMAALGALLTLALRTAEPPATVAIDSVAVLPFANMTGNSGNNYVADGLAEEIIHRLATQKNLAVAARTSAFAFRDSQLPVQEIAGRLGVDAVVEGSLREADGVQRITAQLIDGRSGMHKGSITVDFSQGGLFDAQERMSRAIADMLATAGAPVDPLLPPSAAGDSERAYELYLKGRAELYARTRQSLRNAQAYFEEALRVDPGFAPAHAGIAQLGIVSIAYLGADAESMHELAAKAAAAALAADPDNGDALIVAAVIRAEQRDFVGAIEGFEHALRVQPGNAQAHQWYGECLIMLGQLDAGREAVRVALRLNPLGGSTNTVMAKAEAPYTGSSAMRTAAARADAHGALLAPRYLALDHFRRGDIDGFKHEMNRYYAAIGVDPSAVIAFRAAAERGSTLEEMTEELDALDVRLDNRFAVELALLGLPEAALGALERDSGRNLGSVSDVWLPEMRDVRALPGFIDFVRRLGLPDYWRRRSPPDTCRGIQPEPYCALPLGNDSV